MPTTGRNGIALRLPLLALAALLAQGLPAQEAAGEAEGPGTEDEVLHKLNLGLYIDIEREHSGETHLIPFFSYDYDNREEKTGLVLWPLLTGYYSDWNSSYWFSFPLLSFSGTYRTPEQEMTGFVCLPLLTLSQTVERTDGQTSNQWFSLPLLSLYNSRKTIRDDVSFEFETFSSLLFQHRQINLDYKGENGQDTSVRMSRWALTPLHLKSELDFFTFKDSRWNKDRETQFLYVWDFAIFDHHVRHNYSYPGAYLSEYEWTLQDTFDSGVVRPDMVRPGGETAPITHFGIFDPIFNIESSSSGYSRLELQPFFTHRVRGEERELHLIPFFTTFREDGVRFDPLKSFTKMFPLAYYDENRRRAEILWPLITWEDQDDLQAFRIRTRGLFDYQKRGTYQSIDLVEGLLYDHKWGKGRRKVDVLGGLLYSEEEIPEPGISRWDILRGLIYGEEETPDGSYIKVFMMKFKVRDKVPPEDE